LVTPSVTPAIVDVPDFVMLSLASGVPAVGCTRTFCQVNLQKAPFLLETVIVIVNVVVVLETAIVVLFDRSLILLLFWLPLPPILVISTVGAVPPTSNSNPPGAFSTIVPVPTFPLAASAYIGPVKLVYAPPALSAEIAPPPVAGVRVCACAFMAQRRRAKSPMSLMNGFTIPGIM